MTSRKRKVLQPEQQFHTRRKIAKIQRAGVSRVKIQAANPQNTAQNGRALRYQYFLGLVRSSVVKTALTVSRPLVARFEIDVDVSNQTAQHL